MIEYSGNNYYLEKITLIISINKLFFRIQSCDFFFFFVILRIFWELLIRNLFLSVLILLKMILKNQYSQDKIRI